LGGGGGPRPGRGKKRERERLFRKDTKAWTEFISTA